MRIDEHLGDYRWREVHAIDIAADPPAVLAAVRSVTAGELPLVRLLMGLRALPGRLRGARRASRPRDEPVLDSVLRSGFRLLAEDGRELVVGIVGRFWQACPVHAEVDAARFAGFQEPGWAKAAMNFTVTEGAHGGTRLATETRIAATDAAAGRRFGAYWMLVRPGSGLIRHSWLRAVRRRAERSAQATGRR